MPPKVFKQLSVIIGITAALSIFSQKRLESAGGWFPSVPDTISGWEGTNQPVPQSTLALLGNPRATGREYTNGTGETVLATLVTAGPFENFHDPTVCVGGTGAWEFTSRKEFTLDGPGSAPVRAMIFRQRNNPKTRIIMYYWQQSRDGNTTCEPMMGNFRDLPARLRTGFGAVILGRQSVLLRVYTVYSETDDSVGLSAQRGVHEISRAYYRALLKEGKEG
ncbi:exosortase-associated EpsI family protein [Armatimonas sp.]|uniref:exosortase-associated EpsI family protein n=1 Tax=Armatimonas sp. TaxID=1872638 RepID=UPI0037513AE4